jgi:hypothetical protein
MSQPTPSPQPEPTEEPLDEAATEVAEVPVNRAARRAKAKGTDPSHVGPQGGRADRGRGPRSHTKRRLS